MGIDEKELRLLADKLGGEWESLATHLGFRTTQIDHLRIDGSNRGIGNVVFDMLVSWQQGQPKGVDCKKLLRNALDKAGRLDLGERIVSTDYKYAFDERELRLLAENLCAEWESVATRLGFSSSQIHRFRIDATNRGIDNAVFDLLVSWQQRQPQVVNFRQLLRNALENVGRKDLAEFSYHLEDQKEDVDKVLRCHKEMGSYYLNSLCKVPLYPGDHTTCVTLKDIYTKLSIEIKLPKPCRAIKIPLKSIHDIFTRETEEGGIYTKLLIVAPAGFGKTTTTAKMAYDWATKGKNLSPLSDIKLLFVINMRWVDHTTDLEDAILSQIFPEDTKMTKQRLRTHIEELGDKVVIILDAVDESDRELFRHPESSGSIVKLLTGRILVSCRLLVTTRPWRVPEIVATCKAYTLLELSGFSREDVQTYVRKFFKHDEDLGNALVEYMNQNAIIAEVTTIPLMALLVCIYWQESHEDEIPSRIGQLYDEIFEIMYAHMKAKKTANESMLDEVELNTLIRHIGKMALEGLWPPENKLVFSADNVSNPAVMEEASRMRLIAKEETRRGRLRKARSHADTSTTKVSFFHKSAQEKCAGDYLANLHDTDPKAFSSHLESLTSKEDVLSVQHVLRFACGSSPRAAKEILNRLIKILQSDATLVDDYYKESLDLDGTLTLQQFLEACLNCNYEADCQDEFTRLLLNSVFPNGMVYFLGISSTTALALGYFTKHSQPGDMKSLKLKPIAHPGDFVNTTGPLDKLYKQCQKDVRKIPPGRLQEVCEEYFSRYQGSVHQDHAKAKKDSPAMIVTYIQMWQACQDLPTAEESNVCPIIDALEHVQQLEALDITEFKIGSNNIARLIKACENGHMSQLLQLRVSNIGMVAQQTERLAKTFRHMPSLRGVDISHNESGRCLQYLTEDVSALKSLETLLINGMQASVDETKRFIKTFPHVGLKLQHLRITGNTMNDDVAADLASHLPKANQLKQLWISMDNVTKPFHKKLVSQLCHIICLKKLAIFHSHFPDDLLANAAEVIRSLPDLEAILLGVDNAIPPQVSSTTCHSFMTALQNASKLKFLNLRHIFMERSDFLEFAQVCRERRIRRVRYSVNCIPDDTLLPIHSDIFEFQ